MGAGPKGQDQKGDQRTRTKKGQDQRAKTKGPGPKGQGQRGPKGQDQREPKGQDQRTKGPGSGRHQRARIQRGQVKSSQGNSRQETLFDLILPSLQNSFGFPIEFFGFLDTPWTRGLANGVSKTRAHQQIRTLVLKVFIRPVGVLSATSIRSPSIHRKH